MVCVCVCVCGRHQVTVCTAGEEFDPPDRETVRLQKFGKLLAGPNTDIGKCVCMCVRV